jgi:hypothetical protein
MEAVDFITPEFTSRVRGQALEEIVPTRKRLFYNSNQVLRSAPPFPANDELERPTILPTMRVRTGHSGPAPVSSLPLEAKIELFRCSLTRLRNKKRRVILVNRSNPIPRVLIWMTIAGLERGTLSISNSL